jgi:hypothetical protein
MKSYTLNFVSGRRALRGLTSAARKLAFNEIERVLKTAFACVYG